MLPACRQTAGHARPRPRPEACEILLRNPARRCFAPRHWSKHRWHTAPGRPPADAANMPANRRACGAPAPAEGLRTPCTLPAAAFVAAYVAAATAGPPAVPLRKSLQLDREEILDRVGARLSRTQLRMLPLHSLHCCDLRASYVAAPRASSSSPNQTLSSTRDSSF